MKSLIIILGISLWLVGCGNKEKELNENSVQLFYMPKNAKVLSYEENLKISKQEKTGVSNEEQ